MNIELEKQIEAILFWKGEPLTLAELSRSLGVSSVEIKQALRLLEEKLAGRGIALIRTDNEVALATAPEASALLKRLRQEELSADLGKASLETLAIVLYRAPVSRREIEYIRGVNSTSILRSLLIRGLIERVFAEREERAFHYQPTIALQALLGIHERSELPEFAAVQSELMQFVKKEKMDAETEENQPEHTSR